MAFVRSFWARQLGPLRQWCSGWIGLLAGVWTFADAYPIAWHAHEFLFGYISAAVTGFLLTAIANWTGRCRCKAGPAAAVSVVVGRSVGNADQRRNRHIGMDPAFPAPDREGGGSPQLRNNSTNNRDPIARAVPLPLLDLNRPIREADMSSRPISWLVAAGAAKRKGFERG